MTQPRCELGTDDTHFWWKHECSTGWQETLLPVGADGWIVEQREPLTVTPSILCYMCKVHGFFREGTWVPA